MVGNLSILIRKKEINKSRESKEKIARQKAQRGSRIVPLPLGTSQLGYMPRGNPRRRKGRREDARMRFNKCHRPQVGDVSAPQTRLQGVRFPLDFDNSAPPFLSFLHARPPPVRVLLTSASWDVHPFHVRHTSVTRAKRTPPLCDSSKHDGRESNHLVAR